MLLGSIRALRGDSTNTAEFFVVAKVCERSDCIEFCSVDEGHLEDKRQGKHHSPAH